MREGDHVYFLAPPDRVQALDRFFAERPPQASPDAAPGRGFLRAGRRDARRARGDLRADNPAGGRRRRRLRIISPPISSSIRRAPNDAIPLGPVKLVAHTVTDDRVVTVGLQLAEPEPVPRTMLEKMWIRARRDLRRRLARLRRRRPRAA